ncbi:TetR/AcrR family transcriptional regulator [Streptosporangium sp. KLBMP 9127]|nr:TetR/AcrR family transcriptional regulator [Streptosporangium sp. KLBMP 9127]
MAVEEDPDRTVELLWREPGDAAPRRGLSVGAIVRAAVEIADAAGIEGLSMRSVGERLGFTSMSLYRHVPGKAQLIDLMCDMVMAETGGTTPPGTPYGWREALTEWARRGWALGRRHPWLAEVRGIRHVPGPNSIADFEYALSTVKGIGLTPAEMIAVVGLVGRFVDSEATRVAEVARAERRTGVSEEEWWGARESLFEKLGRYPTLTYIWEAGGYDEPEDSFEFGLRRVLDGVEALVRERDEKRDESRLCAMCGKRMDRAEAGRPRAYCSRACQQRAYRRRRSTPEPDRP